MPQQHIGDGHLATRTRFIRVLLCLVLAYVAFSYWSGQALLVFLMIGLTLQMMVVALLFVIAVLLFIVMLPHIRARPGAPVSQ